MEVKLKFEELCCIIEQEFCFDRTILYDVLVCLKYFLLYKNQNALWYKL